MLPALASSSPATRRRQVVLPHPEGPTRTVNCLSGISSVTLLTATTVPNCLLTCSSNTLAIVRPPAAAQSLHGRPRPASCRHPGGGLRRGGGPPLLPRCGSVARRLARAREPDRPGEPDGLSPRRRFHGIEPAVGDLQQALHVDAVPRPRGDPPGKTDARPEPLPGWDG